MEIIAHKRPFVDMKWDFSEEDLLPKIALPDRSPSDLPQQVGDGGAFFGGQVGQGAENRTHFPFR